MRRGSTARRSIASSTRLTLSSDPFLSSGIIRQRAIGTNARDNNIFRDYRITQGNQTVIDLTTPRQAGKARIYPAGNAIEPYTGTVRYPGPNPPPTLPSPPADADSGSGTLEE
jgi:hypothetical protein